jgi:hypothetical protein
VKAGRKKETLMAEKEEHHGLVQVHVCEDENEADVIIGFLKANGIDAMDNANLPHSIYPVEGDAVVLVHEDDAEKALRLLNEREEAAELEAEDGAEEA